MNDDFLFDCSGAPPPNIVRIERRIESWQRTGSSVLVPYYVVIFFVLDPDPRYLLWSLHAQDKVADLLQERGVDGRITVLEHKG